MAKTLLEQYVSSPEEKRLFEQERAILRVTEMICAEMEKIGMSRADLSKLLGTSKSNVTQMLDGQRNMTIRLIADVLFALGKELRVEAVPLGAVRSTSTQSLTVWHVGLSEQTGYSQTSPATESLETPEAREASDPSGTDVAA
ncbi:MAG: hypothetical protein ACP5HU_08145 [Phycisphaerae bacterium]